MSELVDAKGLAERPRTVKEWLRTGRITAKRLTPKVIRFDLGQVVTALKEHQEVGHD